LAIIELINNLAVLVALSVLSGFIGKRCRLHWQESVAQGLLFGGATVIGMLCPLELEPDAIFDGRSVMLSLCGLFFGPWAVLIAGAMATACRLCCPLHAPSSVAVDGFADKHERLSWLALQVLRDETIMERAVEDLRT